MEGGRRVGYKVNTHPPLDSDEFNRPTFEIPITNSWKREGEGGSGWLGGNPSQSQKAKDLRRFVC